MFLKNYQQLQAQRLHAMAKCVKTNGISSMTITRRSQIIMNYHEGTSHNPSYWETNLKEKEKENFHLPRQFNEECYNVIEVFQRERNVNIPMHVWDLQGLGDAIYVQSKEGHEEIVLVRPFMCKICPRMMMPQKITKNIDNNLVTNLTKEII